MQLCKKGELKKLPSLFSILQVVRILRHPETHCMYGDDTHGLVSDRNTDRHRINRDYGLFGYECKERNGAYGRV